MVVHFDFLKDFLVLRSKAVTKINLERGSFNQGIGYCVSYVTWSVMLLDTKGRFDYRVDKKMKMSQGDVSETFSVFWII